MRHIIEETWNGNLAPAENCGAGNSEMEELGKLLKRNKEKLFQELNAEEKLDFEKYVDCSEEYISLITEFAFCDGFCLVRKLMVEALSEKSEY